MKGMLPATAATIVLALCHPAAAAQTGAQSYAARCSLCHQGAGAGAPGQFPRLAGRTAQIASAPQGRTYMANVALWGMGGVIEVDGARLSGVMQGFSTVSDEELASILTYVSSLQTKKPAKVFTAAEIAAVRAAGRRSAGEVAVMRRDLSAASMIP